MALSGPIIRWIRGESAQDFWAGRCCYFGEVASQSPTAQLNAAVRALTDALEEDGLNPGAFFAHLVPLGLLHPNPLELARILLARQGATEPEMSCLLKYRRLFAELQAADTASAAMNVAPDDAGAESPWPAVWHRHGGNFFSRLSQWLPTELWVDEATIVTVEPAVGFPGRAFLDYNLILWQGALPQSAMPAAEVSAVAPMVWLVAQLQGDLPCFSERILASRRDEVIALAALPACVAVVTESPTGEVAMEPIAEHLAAWQPPGISARSAESLARQLVLWWEAYLRLRPGWEHALRGLCTLLESPSEP